MRGVSIVGTALALVGAAACFKPKPSPGAACDTSGGCPDGLVCAGATQTCELADSAPIDATFIIDGCIPTAEICGNGIDEDCDGADLECASNDKAATPLNITGGGTFTGDTSLATDDFPQHGCGENGGRELFYSLTLQRAEVYYFDTFGSDITTTIRVFPSESCDQVVDIPNPICNRGACGGDRSQTARTFPPGTSCIVIDQDAGETPGMVKLHVVPGTRTGQQIGGGTHTVTANSCNGADLDKPDCTDDGGAKDVAFFMTVCPGQKRVLNASTCVDSTKTEYDTVLYVRDVAGKHLACNDDTGTCAARPGRPDVPDGSVLTGVSLDGPGLYWLVVDGFGGACGNFQLDTDLE